jgi:hypothetical protein
MTYKNNRTLRTAGIALLSISGIFVLLFVVVVYINCNKSGRAATATASPGSGGGGGGSGDPPKGMTSARNPLEVASSRPLATPAGIELSATSPVVR